VSSGLTKSYLNGTHLEVVCVDMSHHDIRKNLIFGNFLSTQTLIIPREAFMSNPFDEELQRFQDWDLLLRMSETFEFVHVGRPLVVAYETKQSITNSSELVAPAMKRILREHRGLFSHEPGARSSYERLLSSTALRNGQYAASLRPTAAWLALALKARLTGASRKTFLNTTHYMASAKAQEI